MELAMIDGLISIGGGAVACYYGFRNPPVSRDPAMTAKWQHWHEHWDTWLKIGGVCLVLFGLFEVFTA
jgi:hypothetical protein